jgi:hypothetical protein
MDLFLSSGDRRTPTLLGLLERVNLNHWTLRSRSHITTDGRSVSMSRYRARSGTCDQILRYFLSEVYFLKVAVLSSVSKEPNRVGVCFPLPLGTETDLVSEMVMGPKGVPDTKTYWLTDWLTISTWTSSSAQVYHHCPIHLHCTAIN